MPSKKHEPVSRNHGGPWHSRLNPFRAQIARWRSAGKTYRDIALLLAKRGLHVRHTSVFKFVRARSTGRDGPRYHLPECLGVSPPRSKRPS